MPARVPVGSNVNPPMVILSPVLMIVPIDFVKTLKRPIFPTLLVWMGF